jgi:putative endonuclease
MSKTFNKVIGKLGEELARNFLVSKGYKILEQNYRTNFSEIDFLCQKGKDKILVEVRTKRGYFFGTPEESLTRKKLRKLWLSAKAVGANRVDAICIVLGHDNKAEKLEHYENII